MTCDNVNPTNSNSICQLPKNHPGVHKDELSSWFSVPDDFIPGIDSMTDTTETENENPDSRIAWKARALRAEARLLNESVSAVEIVPHLLNLLAARVHYANKQWWHDIHTGEPIQRNVGELLMLCVSELSEALEGDRKNLNDDKLPHRKMFEVELADCLIRIFDIAGGLHLDIGGAFEEKMQFNAKRHDHSVEGRKLADGKKY